MRRIGANTAFRDGEQPGVALGLAPRSGSGLPSSARSGRAAAKRLGAGAAVASGHNVLECSSGERSAERFSGRSRPDGQPDRRQTPVRSRSGGSWPGTSGYLMADRLRGRGDAPGGRRARLAGAGGQGGARPCSRQGRGLLPHRVKGAGLGCEPRLPPVLPFIPGYQRDPFRRHSAGRASPRATAPDCRSGDSRRNRCPARR